MTKTTENRARILPSNVGQEQSRSDRESFPVGYTAPVIDSTEEGTVDENEGCGAPMRVVETGYSQGESALLRELLTRSTGIAEERADCAETDCGGNPRARLISYRHRLQALRCECANARLRALDAEEKLNDARSHVDRLERDLEYLRGQLHEMRASRAWKLALRLSGLRQALTRLVSRRR